MAGQTPLLPEQTMTERPAAGERAVIVQLDFGQADLADELDEVRLLVESAGADSNAASSTGLA